MTFSVHYAGEESALKSNNYSLFGFDFAGWNTSKDGTGTTYTNEEIMNLETPQDINLYAQWKLKEYKITYNLNDGYLAETNPTTVYTVSEDFTLNNPTKTGYNFKGWTGTGLSSPTLNVVIKQGTTTDLEFTAVFEVIEYTITYNYGDGSVWKENQTTYTVETPEFKLIEPELEGYDFVGWTGTELSEPTEDIYVGGGMIGNREYTANYELAKFKLYFEIDDEDYYFNGPAMVVVPSSKTVTYSKGYNAEGLFAYTNQIVRGDKDSGTVTHVCIGWQIDDIQVTYDSEFVWEFLEDKVAKPIWMAV